LRTIVLKDKAEGLGAEPPAAGGFRGCGSGALTARGILQLSFQNNAFFKHILIRILF